MRLLLVAVAAVALAWLVRRRGSDDGRRVVVAWQDGSELELPSRSSDGERFVAIARQVIR